VGTAVRKVVSRMSRDTTSPKQKRPVQEMENLNTVKKAGKKQGTKTPKGRSNPPLKPIELISAEGPGSNEPNQGLQSPVIGKVQAIGKVLARGAKKNGPNSREQKKH